MHEWATLFSDRTTAPHLFTTAATAVADTPHRGCFVKTCRVGGQMGGRVVQVNSICFLEPHAALATCNLEGNIAVWRMGPAPDHRRDYRDLSEEDDGGESQGASRDEEKNGGSGGGGRGDYRGSGRDANAAAAADAAAAMKRSDTKKRRTRAAGRSIPPSSTWRCVALFFNNTTISMPAASCLSEGEEGTGGGSQDVPVPAAVNSLAWSSLEERLFTGDTVGFVKVTRNGDLGEASAPLPSLRCTWSAK